MAFFRHFSQKEDTGTAEIEPCVSLNQVLRAVPAATLSILSASLSLISKKLYSRGPLLFLLSTFLSLSLSITHPERTSEKEDGTIFMTTAGAPLPLSPSRLSIRHWPLDFTLDHFVIDQLTLLCNSDIYYMASLVFFLLLPLLLLSLCPPPAHFLLPLLPVT